MKNEADTKNVLESLGVVIDYKLGNEYYCWCPFHASSKARLCVSISKAFFYCHHCERGGTLKKLAKLMKTEEIVSQLFEDTDKGSSYPLSSMVVEDFPRLSLATDLPYLVSRGFENETIVDWKIKKNQMFVVVPLFGEKRNVVGLILRAMLSDYEPRYQIKEFNKKDHILKKIDEDGSGDRMLIVVEGPLDAVKTWQNLKKMEYLDKIVGVCSVMGSSTSRMQREQISRISNQILVLMDNEQSGWDATRKCAESLLGFETFVPRESDYQSKDPAEMSPEELQKVIDGRRGYLSERINGKRFRPVDNRYRSVGNGRKREI